MCTSFNFKNKYYGRNMDLDYDMSNSKIIITPINYTLKYKCNENNIKIDHALIGMGLVINKYPLYYEAMNDKGLYMAGLNFNKFAVYNDHKENKENIATFEFIPHILGQCETIQEVKLLLERINLTNDSFMLNLPIAQLHWIVCKGDEAIVIESTKDGLFVYESKIGVITNNPTYDFHMYNINNYINLTPYNPSRDFFKGIELKNLSHGVGTTGLPGGLGSVDRFVRCTYYKNTISTLQDQLDEITQVFHILDSVSVKRGSVICEKEQEEITVYSSCLSIDNLSYYYKTYTNNQINCVSMNDVDFRNSKELFTFDVHWNQNINYQSKINP